MRHGDDCKHDTNNLDHTAFVEHKYLAESLSMDSQLIRVGRLVFPSVVALMGKKKFKKISEKVADDLKVLSPAPAQVVVETAAEDSKKSTEVYDNTAGE